MIERRSFIRNAIAGLSVLTFSNIPVLHANKISVPQKKSDKFNLGVAGYTFVNFNLEQSLSMMRRADIKYLCIKDFHLPLNSSDEEIANFHQILSKSNVTGYAVGPIYMKSKEDIDKAFVYAKRVGVDLMIGIPRPEDLNYISSKVKEYNIRYAIHNHGPEDKLYPNATVIYNLVKGLDKRVGICLDIGHNTRDKQDLLLNIKQFSDRIFDIHLKDVTSASNEGTTCELGRGVINIPLFVQALRKSNYSGVCSIEHEKDMKDPLAGIAECAGYFRGVVSV
jgi:sugar phosphate isomerase/epimerase